MGLALGCASALHAQPTESPGPVIPDPVADPLRLQLADDPLTRFLLQRTSDQEFLGLVRGAMAANPTVEESDYRIEEAEAARREARSDLFPTIDVSLSTRTSLARNFSDDPDNLIERSRARGRTDATFALNQRLLDFGAASMRIDAAGYRLRAAMFERDRQTDIVALESIAAWYDVFTYRALVELSDSLLQHEFQLRDDIQTRINEGFSARGDLARIDGQLASSAARGADFERQLANAEARFAELYQAPPPEDISRAPVVATNYSSREAVEIAALSVPAVQLTQAQAYAARQEARASRADTLPHINGRIEGGRFGVLETDNDYDIRASLVLEHRFFGGADPRADQAEARAGQQRARADSVREEAIRLARIAWSDVEALEEQLAAVESSYISTRQSRDVIFERFRVARGTLFDVLAAQDDYFGTAVLYIQTVTELDAARYVLLSRTDRLLDALGWVDPSPQSYRLAQ